MRQHIYLHLRVLGLVVLTGCSAAYAESDPVAAVNAVADRYYAWTLKREPEQAYFSDIDLERHDGLFDNSPSALAAAEAMEDELLSALDEIDEAQLIGTPAWITKAYLEQQLRGSVGLRICRNQLWNLNQILGWHLKYPTVAKLQPVATPELRAQAIARWSKFAEFVDQEIINLKDGISAGYSAPKTVVKRIIAQLDGLLALKLEDSPFYSPALRAEDDAFAENLKEIVSSSILPAIRRYREYLATDYLDAARDELTVTANPDGRKCYEASLRSYTMLDRSGEAVHELGQQTVAANRERIIELGKAKYDIDDFVGIIGAAKADAADHFASKEELLNFSIDAVKRAEKAMPDWVTNMPTRSVKVVPFPKNEEGTGRSPHYQSGSGERPGEYKIPLYRPEEQSRGNAETTAFHETLPGHHLQISTAQAVEGLHPVTKIIWFSGPGEGWARYSEGLAEEMKLYQTKTAPILRRAWLARGMVVDPSIHLLGWTREQAIDFIREAGFSEDVAEGMVDRIAVMPGQLTAYDSGGLEIRALREQAESALGDRFDIREFHDQVLANGTIPLTSLRQNIEAWIASKQN